MPLQRKLVASDQLATRAGAIRDQARGGFLLHPDFDSACIILKYLVEFGSLVAASTADSIKALSVLTGKVEEFQIFVATNRQLVSYFSRLH